MKDLPQAKRDVETARRKFAHAVHAAKIAQTAYHKAQARQVDIEFALAEARLEAGQLSG